MGKDENCLYCKRNELQKGLMIEICDLKVSTLFLFKEQSYPGRCVVAFKNHINELFEISEEDKNLFMQDVVHVAKTLQNVFSPAKINYGAYSDKLAHLHFHIVQKYKEGLTFGGTFEMNPNKIFRTDIENQIIIEQIKAQL
jgi:diadenosine tetraphosphate (Ap4A) HIT family hydrolase